MSAMGRLPSVGVMSRSKPLGDLLRVLRCPAGRSAVQPLASYGLKAVRHAYSQRTLVRLFGGAGVYAGGKHTARCRSLGTGDCKAYVRVSTERRVRRLVAYR